MLARNLGVILVFVLVAVAAGITIADSAPRTYEDCKVCGDPPVMYRLDAKYHQLPEGFVRDFLARPPGQWLFQKDVQCRSANSPEGPVNYCICFGPGPCTALKASERCSSEIGLHPSGSVGVCRAATAERFVNPCIVEVITVG